MVYYSYSLYKIMSWFGRASIILIVFGRDSLSINFLMFMYLFFIIKYFKSFFLFFHIILEQLLLIIHMRSYLIAWLLLIQTMWVFWHQLFLRPSGTICVQIYSVPIYCVLIYCVPIYCVPIYFTSLSNLIVAVYGVRVPQFLEPYEWNVIFFFLCDKEILETEHSNGKV